MVTIITGNYFIYGLIAHRKRPLKKNQTINPGRRYDSVSAYL